MRRVVPFAQGVENLRYEAMQRKSYMVQKSVLDAEEPGLFEKMRSPFHQEDHL